MIMTDKLLDETGLHSEISLIPIKKGIKKPRKSISRDDIVGSGFDNVNHI